MADDVGRAGETLASAAPLVFRAQWSLLLQVSGSLRSSSALLALPTLTRPSLSASRRSTPSTASRSSQAGSRQRRPSCVVAPICGQRAVVIGRRGEPPFFRSELARLAHLVADPATPELWDQPVPTTEPGAHRIPVAAPLYSRND